MRVLIGCEFSGRVRDAFINQGHNAVSCDLLPSETPGPHLIGDVLSFINYPWDLMIVHPPCTYLCVSGSRWWKDKQKEQLDSLKFVKSLLECNIPKIALENPIGLISTRIRKPDQIIQPWEFGHGEVKATCLWLKNLPRLRSTHLIRYVEDKVHRMPPSPDRWKNRSRTYIGIAKAMAEQWG